MGELGRNYGCPQCGHAMISHYEIGCALKAECGCSVQVDWHDWTDRAPLASLDGTGEA